MEDAQGWPPEELPLLGEDLAVELANSHYVGDGEDLDFLADHDLAAIWLAAAEAASDLPVPARLSAGALAALRRVRDATRATLIEVADNDGVTPDSTVWRDAADVLHQEGQRAPAHLARDLEADEPTWRLHHRGKPAQALPASIASQCILFLGGDQVSRVRRCERPACPMLFVRQHRARRFCTQACAHSVRQARYYRRSRSSST